MINDVVQTTTGLTLKKLEDHELASLVMTVSFGYDPRNLGCWDKANLLFTSKDANNIPVIHEDVKQVLFQIAKERGVA